MPATMEFILGPQKPADAGAVASILWHVPDAITNIVMDKSILPIFHCRRLASGALQLLAYQGTGFLAHPRIAVTCAHCVPNLVLPEDECYAFVDTSESYWGGPVSPSMCYQFNQVSHDPRGFDLATAAVACPALPVGSLVSSISGVGFDVGCFSYPGTYGIFNPGTDQRQFDVQGRWLQGYVTRGFAFRPPGNSLVHPSWELDITAPAGTSGSPVIVLAPHPAAGQIVGVIYARYPAFAGQADGLIVEPPVWFSLAYMDDVLRGLSGQATGGLSLSQLSGD